MCESPKEQRVVSNVLRGIFQKRWVIMRELNKETGRLRDDPGAMFRKAAKQTMPGTS
jgi:hypothetical protein